MMLDSRFFNPHPQRNQIFAPAAPLPLPVLVVTGFLGSGKTTLVKQSPGLVRHFFWYRDVQGHMVSASALGCSPTFLVTKADEAPRQPSLGRCCS